MAAKLTVQYDRLADILYLTSRPSYPEQDTEELGDDIVARLNPRTGEIESLEILFFSTRGQQDSVELPVLNRRDLLRGVVGAVAATGLSARPAASQQPLKIGIIGSGRIGGTMGEHWVKAGHEIMFSSRHPENLKEMAAKLGPRARVGTPREAAAFGQIIFIAVPYSAIPQVGSDYANEMKGKVVVNASNPIPRRDGPVAEDAQKKGAGAADIEHLPGTRIARAFTFPGAGTFKSEAHRAGERIAVAVAGDDKDAVEVASRLVRDAGFEPVVVGPLARAKDFQPGTPIFGKAMTAREMKQALGLP